MYIMSIHTRLIRSAQPMSTDLFDKYIISDTVHVAMSGIKRYYEDQASVQNQTDYYIDYRPTLALTGVSSSLSVFGSLLIFLSFYKDRERIVTFRILVCLTIADCFNAVGNILGVIRYSHFGSSLVITQPSSCHSDNFCVSQSFISVFASLSSFWWTFLAALNHLLHYRGSHCLEYRLIWILSHIIGWGSPRK